MPKADVPYHIDFDSNRDVSMQDKDAMGKRGLFVTVRFDITLDGAKVPRAQTDYKVVIEEDGHRVWEQPIPRPTPSDELSVMLAIDTSGSMDEHGRMAQAARRRAFFSTSFRSKPIAGLFYSTTRCVRLSYPQR